MIVDREKTLDPYRPPAGEPTRVFKTPIVVPLSVIMVIAIYAGYILLHVSGEEVGVFPYLQSISLEVFLLCEIGMVSLIACNKAQLDGFLKQYPTIANRQALDALKSIVRTNMVSALFMLAFLALGSLTAIISILNHGLAKAILVAVLSIATARLLSWYNPLEEKVKQIECRDAALEIELNEVLQCWMHKPFPNF